MKPRACTAVALSFLVAGGCRFTAEISFLSGSAENDFRITTPFDGVESLTVEWSSGDVAFRIDEAATEITAAGTLAAIADDDATATASLDAVQISFDTGAPDVLLRLDLTDNVAALVFADVEVTVPAGVRLRIVQRSGAVTVSGNSAASTIEVTNGAVTVTGQSGEVNASADNGSIDIDSLDGDVSVSTANGSINVRARPGSTHSVSADSVNGSIFIHVPADTAADLLLRTGTGAVSFSLTDFTVTNLEVGFDEVTATLNGGGGLITGDTLNGVIVFGSLAGS